MEYENDLFRGYRLGSLPEGPVEELERASRAVARDGIVLLENRGALLPLRPGEKVAVFGRAQMEYYKSGTGSGGMVNVKYVTQIYDSLRARGTLALNEELAGVYTEYLRSHPFDKGRGWAAEPFCQVEMPLSDEVVARARELSDTALVVIGRVAGEDKDNAAERGSFLLSEGEEAMLRAVRAHFERVCVILNVGNIIDMKWVRDYDIPAVLCVWQGGMCGGEAAADVLLGDYAPAGKLADTIARDISDYPAAGHFGDAAQNVYAEDIYVGYRYFETFCPEKVLYPFGFGLSYTTFDVRAEGYREENGQAWVKASVCNTGSTAGREVVQVYVSAPEGRLGKPARVLAAFGKTALLAPGETQTLVLSWEPETIASYDEEGVSGTPHSYVLEAGTYTVLVGTDVRNAAPVFAYDLPRTVVEVCHRLCTPCTPFDRLVNRGGEMRWEPAFVLPSDEQERLRADLPPAPPYTGDRGIKLRDVREGRAAMEDFVAQLPDSDLMALTRGEGMNSPKVTAGTGGCWGGVTGSLIGFGVPIVCCTDGPSGIRMDSGALATSMPGGACIACSFDTEMAEDLYQLEGVEMTANKIDVILGPGINIHRHPLGGRNFEYFSEDPLLTGRLAAAISRGVAAAGVECTIKHFLANNQEFHRHDVDAVLTERALREIYAKPFEIAVKEGGAGAVMTSYNPVNGTQASSHWDLTHLLLREEWGFGGVVMTDWWAKKNGPGGSRDKNNNAQMVRADGDLAMVVPCAENYPDNEAECLQKGLLTRGELARAATHVLTQVMHSHAFERFAAAGYTYDLTGCDVSGMTEVAVFDGPGPGESVDWTCEASGAYLLVVEYASERDEAAQLVVTFHTGEECWMGERPTVLVCNGTSGKPGKSAVPVSLMTAKMHMSFACEADFRVLKFHLYR